MNFFLAITIMIMRIFILEVDPKDLVGVLRYLVAIGCQVLDRLLLALEEVILLSQSRQILEYWLLHNKSKKILDQKDLNQFFNNLFLINLYIIISIIYNLKYLYMNN